jgi:hypothetical protein
MVARAGQDEKKPRQAKPAQFGAMLQVGHALTQRAKMMMTTMMTLPWMQMMQLL